MLKAPGRLVIAWMVLAVSAEIPFLQAHTGSVSRLRKEGRQRPLLLEGMERCSESLESAELARLYDSVVPRKPLPRARLWQLPPREPRGRGSVGLVRPVRLDEVPVRPVPVPAWEKKRRSEADWFLRRRRLTDRFDALILRYSERYGLDPRLVKSVIAAESSFRRTARSRAGALGLMQLMPRTAEELGVSRWLLMRPEHNIRAGAAYLAHLFRRVLRRYGIRARSAEAPVWVVRRVLAAYNAGPRFLYRTRLFKCTERYIRKVLYYYRDRLSDLRARPMVADAKPTVPLPVRRVAKERVRGGGWGARARRAFSRGAFLRPAGF